MRLFAQSRHPARAWLMPRFTPRILDKTPRAAANRIVFDHACKLTGIYFHDETFGGHDWPAIREKYRPGAVAAKNNEALYATNTMLKELGSSHAAAIAPEIVRMQKKMRDEAVSLLGYISVKLPGVETPVIYEIEPGGRRGHQARLAPAW